MSRLSIFHVTTILAAAAFAVPGVAFAQTTSAAPAQAAEAPASPAPKLAPNVAGKVDHHIQDLHTQLQITPAEEPQWQQFADVMRSNAAQMGEAFKGRADKLSSMSAADNMQSYAQIAQVHAGNMQKLATAFQTLYASFSDAQKKNADTVFHNNHTKIMMRRH